MYSYPIHLKFINEALNIVRNKQTENFNFLILDNDPNTVNWKYLINTLKHFINWSAGMYKTTHACLGVH